MLHITDIIGELRNLKDNGVQEQSPQSLDKNETTHKKQDWQLNNLKIQQSKSSRVLSNTNFRFQSPHFLSNQSRVKVTVMVMIRFRVRGWVWASVRLSENACFCIQLQTIESLDYKHTIESKSPMTHLTSNRIYSLFRHNFKSHFSKITVFLEHGHGDRKAGFIVKVKLDSSRWVSQEIALVLYTNQLKPKFCECILNLLTLQAS